MLNYVHLTDRKLENSLAQWPKITSVFKRKSGIAVFATETVAGTSGYI